MHFLARGLGRFLQRFILFYWICFTFPFPLDLIGLPLQLVEQKSQPEWLQKASEYYGAPLAGLYDTKNNANCQLIMAEQLVGRRRSSLSNRQASGDTLRTATSAACAGAGICSFVLAALVWTSGSSDSSSTDGRARPGNRRSPSCIAIVQGSCCGSSSI